MAPSVGSERLVPALAPPGVLSGKKRNKAEKAGKKRKKRKKRQKNGKKREKVGKSGKSGKSGKNGGEPEKRKSGKVEKWKSEKLYDLRLWQQQEDTKSDDAFT